MKRKMSQDGANRGFGLLEDEDYSEGGSEDEDELMERGRAMALQEMMWRAQAAEAGLKVGGVSYDDEDDYGDDDDEEEEEEDDDEVAAARMMMMM
jgi:hypothetical protein